MKTPRLARGISEPAAVYRAIFDRALDAILLADDDLRFVDANAAAAQLTGYSREELLCMRVSDLSPPALRDAIAANWRTFLEAGEQSGRFELQTRDGRTVALQYRAVAHVAPGLHMSILRDITREQRAEEALTSLERRAAERTERESAAAADRFKDQFLAVVSHELRTPLNAILGWSRLLKAGQLDDDGRQQATEIIERNVQAQSQIIEDLLDVSRSVTGRLQLEISDVNLAHIARAVVASLGPAADAKRMTVVCDLDERAIMSGDPARLQQVTWNLVSNAIKFTPPGGRVDVYLRRGPERIELSVTDTGSGIRAAMLPRVFDRFLQEDGSTARQHGGLGLGLAIVRHLVELHGGTVLAESGGPGRGSTFRIRFPATPAGADRSRR